MPAVVSDTSVLHYLAAAGHFALLRVQFNDLLIPPAVRAEVEAAGTRAVVLEVRNASMLYQQLIAGDPPAGQLE